MREPPLGVKVPADINKGNQARITLQCVKPVLHPRILRNVRLASPPDVDSVAAVKQNRQHDHEQFDQRPEWNGLQISGNGIVFVDADQSCAIGPEMLRQKCANGNYAAQRMKFSEEITRVRTGCRCGHALSAAQVLCSINAGSDERKFTRATSQL